MKKKKRKIKYKSVLKTLLVLIVLVFFLFYFSNLKITNIYIKGNSRLSDLDVIKIAKLEDYPSLVKIPNYLIKKRLIKDSNIIDAKVYKKLTKVYIEIKENMPLFYNNNLSKTVMLDKSLKDIKVTPYLVNYVPDTIYDKFVNKMALIDEAVLTRISDITYQPNSVDDERFYLAMSDGNYVYLNLNTFTKLNNYTQMLKQFGSHKGILYLDSGEYFEIKN